LVSGLHLINEDVILKTPVDQQWVLKVYNPKVAFLNANPGTKMYIQILDEMLALGFITMEEQLYIL